MNRFDENMTNTFKEAFQDFQPEVPAGVYAGVRSKMAKKGFWSFGFTSLNVWTIGLLIGLSALAWKGYDSMNVSVAQEITGGKESKAITSALTEDSQALKASEMSLNQEQASQTADELGDVLHEQTAMAESGALEAKKGNPAPKNTLKNQRNVPKSNVSGGESATTVAQKEDALKVARITREVEEVHDQIYLTELSKRYVTTDLAVESESGAVVADTNLAIEPVRSCAKEVMNDIKEGKDKTTVKLGGE